MKCALWHTALSFSSLSGRPLEGESRSSALRATSGPIGDTLRGSEVGDVGGINQEDVLAKQGEEHVRDPLEINLSMFSLYRPPFSRALFPSRRSEGKWSNNV